jgi:hypothetical protein
MSKLETDRNFVAEAISPAPVRLYLSHTGIGASSFGSFEGLGWQLVVNKLTPAGGEEVFRDHWEETLLEILRYIDDYSDAPLQWRREHSGELTDLRDVQPVYDASKRYETAVRTATSPDGGQRLCFNLFDDGRYRFTLEEQIREGDLSAWVPRRWSSEHPNLADAETEARNAFSWFG